MTVPGVGGYPLAYKTAEEFREKVNAYFDYCDSQIEVSVTDRGQEKVIQKPYTISGLCLYLGISRETLREYKARPGYAPIVVAARNRVENYCEEGTMKGKLNPIFSIFSLKNNFNWTDKIELNTNSQPERLDASDIKAILGNKGKKAVDKDKGEK
jgi:hypothetical protein